VTAGNTVGAHARAGRERLPRPESADRLVRRQDDKAPENEEDAAMTDQPTEPRVSAIGDAAWPSVADRAAFQSELDNELTYLHSRDVSYATFCQGPYEESSRYRDFMRPTGPPAAATN
jgi:hypothetical protein